MAKAAFNNTKTLFIRNVELNLRKKLINCYIWSISLYGTGIYTLRRLDQKYLGEFECGVVKDREDLLDRSCKK